MFLLKKIGTITGTYLTNDSLLRKTTFPSLQK